MTGEVDAGGSIGFTIAITNVGPGMACKKSDFTVDPLPTGVTFSVTPPVEGCAVLVGVLLCEVGDLASGDGFEVHISAPTPGGLPGDLLLPAACKEYENIVTVIVGNGVDGTAGK